jgi:serine 3-dehydrogenase
MTKTAFITGATAGIGEASARRFVAEGWQVVGTGRRRDRLDRLAEELGDAFQPLMLDMRQTQGFQAALDSLPESRRGIDLLLNNAGLAPPMSPLQFGSCRSPRSSHRRRRRSGQL